LTAPFSLLADPRRGQVRQLMLVLDHCNARFGGDVVKVGLFPSSTFWRTKQQFAAPGYTVKWREVVKLS
jgi:hypothetical protein